MSVEQLFKEMRTSFELEKWEDFEPPEWFSEYDTIELALIDCCHEECSFKFKGKDVEFIGIFGNDYDDGCINQDYTYMYEDEFFCIYGYYDSWGSGEIYPTPYEVTPFIYEEIRYKKGKRL